MFSRTESIHVRIDEAEDNIALAVRPETAVGSAPGIQASGANYADPNRFWTKPSKREEAEKNLQRYERELAENPDGDIAALTLVRMGNVCYSRLQEYDNAATYYERLLNEHPDYDYNLQNVYGNLAACYERLDNRSMARSTYRRMITQFGSGSQEALFAEQQLRKF